MNKSTPSIDRLQEADRPAVHALLRSHRLPLEGFDDHHVDALVAKNQNVVIGSAAIEIYGRYGLLRSVAVADGHRGQDVGTQLTRAAIARARELDLSALYLLTETASAFFPRFGFAAVSREQIPVDVKASVEFTTACPASAQAFHLLLKEEGVQP
jgi:amino-acid N-acetyltransferase